MGAAPKFTEQMAVVSPLLRLEQRTGNVLAFPRKPGPRGFARVPTHAVGVASDRRASARAWLSLPLRLIRVGESPESMPVTLVTKNISSGGIYFLAPREIGPGTAIELEVALIERALGCGRVRMLTAAHIVRAEDTTTPGWHGYGASFDDFALRRDDAIPIRYQASEKILKALHA